MNFKLKLLTIAIVSTLPVSGVALAGVTIGGLDTSGAAVSSVPVSLAKEAVFPSAGKDFSTSPFELVVNPHYSLTAGETRHVRVECTNMKFKAVPSTDIVATPATPVSPATPTFAVGAPNGIGSNAISFSLANSQDSASGAASISIKGTKTVLSAAPVTCTAALYDQPSQAANGGDTGKIVASVVSDTYINFKESYAFSSVAGADRVADVSESTGTYFKLVQLSTPTLADKTLANLGTAKVELASPATVLLDGTNATLGGLLAETSTIDVEGDFSLAKKADGTYDLTKVYLGDASCAALGQPASAIVDGKASFTLATANMKGVNVCYTLPGTVAIPASTYKVNFLPVSKMPSDYTTNPASGKLLASITRNGTVLKAPVATGMANTSAYVSLLNSGSQDATFKTKCYGSGVASKEFTSGAKKDGSLVEFTVKKGESLRVPNIAFCGGDVAYTSAEFIFAVPEGQIVGTYVRESVGTGGSSSSANLIGSEPKKQ